MHKHHIIPRHMGGTDNPENIIELSVEDHAEAHRLLFEQHGHWEDYLAWQGLAGLISKEDLIKKIQSEAAKARLEKHGNPFSGIRTWGNFSINEEFRKQVSSLANSPEAIAKKKKTMAERNHQQGFRNSQFGKVWCVDKNALDLYDKKMYSRDKIPDGFITTTEWKELKKDKKNSAYGKHWYNDGEKNYYLKPESSLIDELKLEKGRLNK